MIKLAIDITTLLDQYSNRGIGTYTRNLVYELLTRSDINIHLLGFKTEKENLNKLGLEKLPTNAFFYSLGAVKPSSIRNIGFTRQKYLPLLKRIEPDVYICPNFERGIIRGYKWKNMVVIHDIIPIITHSFSAKSPLHNFIKEKFYKHQLKKALKAELIVTVSEYSKHKIQSWFNIPDNKILVNYLALDKEFYKKVELEPRRANVILKSLRIKNDYILYYGGLEANKNIFRLIEAFKILTVENENLALVIVSNEIRSKHDNSYIIKGENGKKIAKLIKKLRLKDKVIFPGELGKEDLKILTSNANMFVHLSKFEGFGLSVLEAVSLGTPTLISNIPVYKEVFYKNAVLVNPDDTDAIAKSIDNLLKNKELQTTLLSEKDTLLKKLTWEKHINKLASAIDLLLNISLNVSNSDRLKLGYVIPHFYPFVGGAENYTLDIASLAAKSNFDVSTFTSKNTKYENEFDVYNRIKIFRSPVLINQYYLKFYPGLLKTLLNTKIDILHVQGFGFIWQDICLILKKFLSRKKIKYINTPHGPFMARNNYNVLQKNLRKFFISIQKLYLNWLYESVIQVNPEQYKWIEKDYGIKKSKIKFLPIGINQNHFESAVVPPKLVKKFEALKNKVIITYVGRFHKYKGVKDLLIAVHRLINETDFKNIHVVLMGKDAGELAELKKFRIESFLEEYVEIIEEPTDDVRNYILNQSQVFVFPSEWEAYGIAMLEAMAHKNAIISTRTEGGQYLVENNVNGILYPFNDTNALFKALVRLIGNPQLREDMMQLNYQKAQSLQWENIWEEYEALYKENLI